MENEPKTAKQHAVPQNIMEVEFKLIGDMTIRQFLYVAVGGFFCFLIYSGGIPFLIRWFLILLIAFLALGMAFLPMEERGLDEWIRNFFVACYLPTQRVWKKFEVRVERKRKAELAEKIKVKLPALPKTKEKPKGVEEEEVKKITEELRKVAREMGKEVPREKDLAEEAEKISKNLERMLAEITRTEEVPGRPLAEEDTRLKEKVREFSAELSKLKKLEEMRGISPDVKRTIAYYRGEATKLGGKIKSLEERLARKRAEEGEKKEEERFVGEEEYRKQIEALREENKTLTDKISQTTEEFEKLKGEIRGLSEEKGGYTHVLQEKEEELKRLEEERNRAISDLMRLSSRMEKVKERGVLPGEEERKEAEREVSEKVVHERPPRPKKLERAKPLFSREELAAITSNVPNTISGIVKDREGKILSGVMIVVEDEDGEPVRAIKANKLGQFLFSIPLPNGKYTVRVESKERKFPSAKLICDGSILEPIVFVEQ